MIRGKMMSVFYVAISFRRLYNTPFDKICKTFYTPFLNFFLKIFNIFFFYFRNYVYNLHNLLKIIVFIVYCLISRAYLPE